MSESIRKVVRCKGHTKSGARCARRTAKTPYCYQHLKSEQHLQVKQSHIKEAGLGLYTTIDRKKNKPIIEYTGRTVVSHNPDYGGDYVLQVKNDPPTFINADETTDGAGRFSNMARRGQGYKLKNNSQLATDRGKGSLKATKNIKSGDEILTNYGAGYWRQKEKSERYRMLNAAIGDDY